VARFLGSVTWSLADHGNPSPSVRCGLLTIRTLSLRQGALVMVKRWNTSAEHERRILLVSFFAQRLSQSYARRRYAW
jgi:hypothetical protein